MNDYQENKPINAQLHDGFWENYVNSTNLKKSIDECQAFYNGDQWKKDQFDSTFPKPVLNIISYSSNLKSSKICGTPLYFAISSNDDHVDCSKLRQFDEYIQSGLKSKAFNFQSCLNGFNNGTEIAYYRYDVDNESVQGLFKGGLAIEHIDPRRFAVANPHIQDIQKQKWVMFWNDVEVGAIKEMLQGEGFSKSTIEGKCDLIEREGNNAHFDDTNNDKDKINHALATVYTRFFRINGEVYYDCSTSNVELFHYPHAMSTILNASIVQKVKDAYDKAIKSGEIEQDGSLIKDLDIDFEDVTIGDSPSTPNSDGAHKRIKERFNLYPFAIFTPYAINDSFFGRSDVKSQIALQKATNYSMALMIQCVQNSALNKIFVKPGTLNGQKVTTEAGQVITDYSQFTNGWGIKFAESQPIPNDMFNFIGQSLQFASKYYGYSDVLGGNVSNQDISGYAVQQMIKQANTPIEQQQQLFWEFQVEQFSVRLLFYKFYIDKANYTYDLTDGEVQEQELYKNKLLALSMAHKADPNKVPALINSDGSEFSEDQINYLRQPVRKTKMSSLSREELWGVDFDIRVDAQQGLSDSKLTEEQFWDNLILNGGIQNLTPDMLDLYIQGSPAVAPQMKAELRRLIENLKRSENQQLKNQLQQAQQTIQQLGSYAKQLEQQLQIKSVYVDNLTKEFTDKINSQNKVIGYQSQLLAQSKAGVSQGEGKSLNARGVTGTNIAPETTPQTTVQ